MAKLTWENGALAYLVRTHGSGYRLFDGYKYTRTFPNIYALLSWATRNGLVYEEL